MRREFDLLGDPIPDNLGKPGANGHIATADKVNKVKLLVVAKWTSAQIAEELGISVPTLRRHYFRNRSIKRARKHSISEIRGRVLLLLDQQAKDGNVAAIKELGKIVEKAHLEDLADLIGNASPKRKTPGKKQSALAAAI